jgi:hypothetical protein
MLLIRVLLALQVQQALRDLLALPEFKDPSVFLDQQEPLVLKALRVLLEQQALLVQRELQAQVPIK